MSPPRLRSPRRRPPPNPRGVRVETVADPLMQKIRYLDNLIDELAKGEKMPTILRQ